MRKTIKISLLKFVPEKLVMFNNYWSSSHIPDMRALDADLDVVVGLSATFPPVIAQLCCLPLLVGFPDSRSALAVRGLKPDPLPVLLFSGELTILAALAM